MECKSRERVFLRMKSSELIDTLWNVNISVASEQGLDTSELIDTLWNVNTKAVIFSRPVSLELIDTLWNVNSEERRRIRRALWN